MKTVQPGLLCGGLTGDQKAFSSNTEKYRSSLSSTTNTKLQISITGSLPFAMRQIDFNFCF